MVDGEWDVEMREVTGDENDEERINNNNNCSEIVCVLVDFFFGREISKTFFVFNIFSKQTK